MTNDYSSWSDNFFNNRFERFTNKAISFPGDNLAKGPMSKMGKLELSNNLFYHPTNYHTHYEVEDNREFYLKNFSFFLQG